ncbi:MAG: 4-(cytidine 5'-diphospho)-2-C-methyl-D-erythritol kinase [Cyclobacteriaceae bacterium]
MLTFPNAKVNLGLHVLAKREDGYHNLESCFYPILWRDSLEIITAKKFSFESYGLKIPGSVSENLCVKAYELIKADFDISAVEIHLLKSIPMGAGLGGGSADGAFTLKLLNEHFKLEISISKLQEYALQLGSDCPFFIANKPVIAKGRGEVFEKVNLDLTDYYLAIKNPEVHISTKEAFSNISPATPKLPISEILELPISEWSKNLVNNFETSVFPNHPEIARLKDDMYSAGALYASMTGTGSTVYGIFREKPQNSDWMVLEM